MYQLIKNYRGDSNYRSSFFDLAKKIFGLDFDIWYQKGCWNDQYICYSFVDEGQVIANASANFLTVIKEGKPYKLIQLGTVMTAENYRRQGLAKQLIKTIIADYQDEVDGIYLFANETVLDFYPKIGFERQIESNFTINHATNRLEGQRGTGKQWRQLNPDNQDDWALLTDYSQRRLLNSTQLDVIENEALLGFYFMLAFKDKMYYSDTFKTIVLCEEIEKTLYLYDVLSLEKVKLKTLITSLASKLSETTELGFMSQDDSVVINAEEALDTDDYLFVLPGFVLPTVSFLFPLTSHG